MKKGIYTSNIKKRKDVSHTSSVFVLLGIMGFVIFAFYLWGKVQIDFVLWENDRLEQEKVSLQRERDDLRIQIDYLESYQRIVGLAKKQGLVFISPNSLEELHVDLKGLEDYSSKVNTGLQVAGFY